MLMTDLTIEAVLGSAEQHLMVAAGDSREAGWLLEALAPEARLARRFPTWPVIRLPLDVHQALGGDPAQAVELAAACALFFASADAIDDAQDGDLAPEAFGGHWQQAVNAGNALIFLSQGVALAASPTRTRGRVAEAFARAGLAMSLGQARDLTQKGAATPSLSEADYLETIRGKAGASFRLYAALSAIALGRSPALVTALDSFGMAFGTAIQLASDLRDLAAPDSRDLRNRQPTLPVLAAWHRLAPGDRPLLFASWQGEPDAVPIMFFLERTGAWQYAQARLAALKSEAELALESRAVPKSLRAALQAAASELTAHTGAGVA
jgi:hypothetical protein